jgi:MFS family permease
MVAVFTSGPGQTFVFSVFVDPILSDTGLSRTELSFLYSLGTIFSAIMALFISRMVDLFGPRLLLGLIALMFGSACFGIAWATGGLGLLIGFAALRAFGQGSLTMTATLLTIQWFVRYRGRAIGLVSLGMAASNAFFPPVTQWLISTVGWRNSYRILGVTIWLLVIPAAIFIVRNRPENMGLHPDGLLPSTPLEPTPVEPETPEITPEQPHQDSPLEAALAPESARIWRSLRFWQLVLPLSSGPFMVTALIFHQISIFGERGQGPEVVSVVFVVWALSSAVMTVLMGFILERFEPKLVLFGNLLFLMLGTLCLLLVNSLFTALLYAVILGGAGGGQFVVSGVIWVHYYGRERVNAYQGASALVGITSAALAPLPLAALQQATGSYTMGIIAIAAIPLVCGLILWGFKTNTPAA